MSVRKSIRRAIQSVSGNDADHPWPSCSKALLATLVFGWSATAHSQSNIEGYVYGTGRAGSEVRIENTETGYSRTATVQRSGSFRTPNVPPGVYQVTYTNPSGESVSREVIVTIGAGTSVDSFVETVVVYGETVKQIDLSNTESVTTLTSARIDQLPVPREIEQVALLAPGVIQGDGGFTSQSGKPLVSFGGASPGENGFFMNGFNITDFRNFLGGATVPYEFYDQFELRTGGYSAEFGRSLGGVINAVSKRGTNNYQYSVAAYWQPEALSRRNPNSYYSDPASGARLLRRDNSQDYNSEWQFNISAGGPIIEDKLFFYGLSVLREVRDDDAVGTTSLQKTTDDSPFFGGKLDWQIADDHAFEYTYMRDRIKTDVTNLYYSSVTRQTSGVKSSGLQEDGGDTHILRYSGVITDNLSASALYGHSARTESSSNLGASGDPCIVVIDARGGQSNPLNCWDGVNLQTSDTKDVRDAYRLDLSYLIGGHAIKLGYDYESNKSRTFVEYEGGVYYRYVNATPGDVISAGTVPDGVFQLAREQFYNVRGRFKEKLTAMYLEDSWQVTDRWLLSLGLRNETLENFNRDGKEFLDFGSQLTPRFGFSYDLFANGRTKLYGNAGRYTMPIATNTNIRFAGGEFFTRQYYVLQGVNPDGTPILGAPVGIQTILSDGELPVPQESVSRNIKPMYQDEFILGLQSALTDTTTVGLKVTYRDLVRAVEDSAFEDGGSVYYFLFNPGSDVILRNPDGTYSTITAAQLGMPEATRKHWAAELTFDQQFGAAYRMSGSYTWSHTYGNFEGVFQSDVQQDDAGITIAFDYPGLTLYSNGDLPNDRRHNFKLYGAYSPSRQWTLNFQASAISGRPKNARGNCGVLDPQAYAQDCFVVQTKPSPRGSAGRLPWTYNVNLGVRYAPSFFDGVSLGVDLFNVFNFQEATRIQEIAQQAGGDAAPLDPSYGAIIYYQEPFSARLSARWDFK